ncbi:hypothetical protein [Streptomyces sp. NPDC086787]|uniref:hypothetical protein n=1 Tax=Streptomyces sp. NPDC086787 TaxID=3365759 RepID=UPI00380A7253
MSVEKPETGGRGSGLTGLTITAAGFTFVALRLFAVSGYNWHTAFAVLHTLDVGDTVVLVLGTVMADSLASVLFLTVLVPVALLRMALERQKARQAVDRARAEGRPPERPDVIGSLLLLIALVVVVAYLVTFHSWWLLLLIGVVCGLVYAIGHGVRAGGRVRRTTLWISRHLWALAVLTILLGAATLRTPWVPMERVELRNGKELTGFVMATEPGFLKLLTEHDRELLIVRDEDVISREEITSD